MKQSDSELLERDVKLTNAQRMEYLEEKVRYFQSRIDQLTAAVRFLLDRPTQHAISAEEATALHDVRASL